MLFAVIVFIKIKFSFYHKLLILAWKRVKVYHLLAEDERFLSMGSFPVYSTLCTALVATVSAAFFPLSPLCLCPALSCLVLTTVFSTRLGQNLRKKPQVYVWSCSFSLAVCVLGQSCSRPAGTPRCVHFPRAMRFLLERCRSVLGREELPYALVGVGQSLAGHAAAWHLYITYVTLLAG